MPEGLFLAKSNLPAREASLWDIISLPTFLYVAIVLQFFRDACQAAAGATIRSLHAVHRASVLAASRGEPLVEPAERLWLESDRRRACGWRNISQAAIGI